MTPTRSVEDFRAESGRWIPILDGDEAARAENIVDHVATALADVEPEGATLVGGSAGLALFFGYLAGIRAGPVPLEATTRLLTHAAQGQLEPDRLFSFLRGRTGVGWVLAHLARRLPLADDDYGFSHESFSRDMLNHVRLRPWRGVHDHSEGIAGCGLYALECRGNPYTDEILEQVIDRLGEAALHRDGGVTWWVPPHTLPESTRQRSPLGGFNLGLAHGIPSIIAFLGHVCRAGIAAEKARRLLDGAMAWLLAQRNATDERARFDAFVPLERDGTSPDPPSVRWCYGDLGVSAAIYWAGISADNPTWTKEGLDLARCVARRPIIGVGVRDAGLCHGAAGNAHVFNRFYQATREDVFLEAARRWLRRALSFHRPQGGLGGFQIYSRVRESPEVEWQDHVGIFGGSAGVGLTFLAAIGEIEPAWDRIMMVSLPPALG